MFSSMQVVILQVVDLFFDQGIWLGRKYVLVPDFNFYLFRHSSPLDLFFISSNISSVDLFIQYLALFPVINLCNFPTYSSYESKNFYTAPQRKATTADLLPSLRSGLRVFFIVFHLISYALFSITLLLWSFVIFRLAAFHVFDIIISIFTFNIASCYSF